VIKIKKLVFLRKGVKMKKCNLIIFLLVILLVIGVSAEEFFWRPIVKKIFDKDAVKCAIKVMYKAWPSSKRILDPLESVKKIKTKYGWYAEVVLFVCGEVGGYGDGGSFSGSFVLKKQSKGWQVLYITEAEAKFIEPALKMGIPRDVLIALGYN
jgi:hypothetical protein